MEYEPSFQPAEGSLRSEPVSYEGPALSGMRINGPAGHIPVSEPALPQLTGVGITKVSNGGIRSASPTYLLTYNDPFGKQSAMPEPQPQPQIAVDKARLRGEIRAQLIMEKAQEVKGSPDQTLRFEDPAAVPSFVEICRKELYRRLKISSDQLEASAKEILAIKQELDGLDVFVSKKAIS